MGRRTIQVDRAKLTSAILTSEANGPLPTQHDVWLKSAEIYNQNSPPETITHSVAMLRAKQWGIEIKTQSARGGHLRKNGGDSQPAKQPKRMKAICVETSKQIKKQFAGKQPTRIKQLAGGSLRAAIDLKCIDCCNCWDGSKEDITNCAIVGCSLWPFRPFQKGENCEE